MTGSEEDIQEVLAKKKKDSVHGISRRMKKGRWRCGVGKSQGRFNSFYRKNNLSQHMPQPYHLASALSLNRVSPELPSPAFQSTEKGEGQPAEVPGFSSRNFSSLSYYSSIQVFILILRLIYSGHVRQGRHKSDEGVNGV